MSGVEIATSDPAATERLAALLAKQCTIGDCILLRGDLGAGKTVFARGFIRALQRDVEEIVSPTFTLVQQYVMGNRAIWHFDLYRLKDQQELREIGLEDALQYGITLIEWPDLAKDWLPASALNVSITFGSAPEERIFILSGLETWQARLAAVEKAFYNR